MERKEYTLIVSVCSGLILHDSDDYLDKLILQELLDTDTTLT